MFHLSCLFQCFLLQSLLILKILNFSYTSIYHELLLAYVHALIQCFAWLLITYHINSFVVHFCKNPMKLWRVEFFNTINHHRTVHVICCTVKGHHLTENGTALNDTILYLPFQTCWSSSSSSQCSWMGWLILVYFWPSFDTCKSCPSVWPSW